MAEIKLNVSASDRIKATLGDLGIEIEIPASALFEFVKGQMTLQDVTDNGAVTTDDVTVNKLIVAEGVQFSLGTLVNVTTSEFGPLSPDIVVELTIEDTTILLVGQIKV